MNRRTIIILAGFVILFFAGAVVAGYFLSQPSKNATSNATNNNTTTIINQSSINQSQSTQSDYISAAKAKSIASQYLSSNSKYKNFAAGTPTLKGSVYYVPMVVANDNSQGVKGTVVGNVKVDARTGSVLGTESWNIETGEPINQAP